MATAGRGKAVERSLMDTALMLREFCTPLEVQKKRWSTMNEQKVVNPSRLHPHRVGGCGGHNDVLEMKCVQKVFHVCW